LSTANLYDLFRQRTAAHVAEPFLETGRADFSYGDLDAESGRYARLLKDSGVAPGDRVIVQVEKSPEAVFLYLACLRAGAIYIPLNTAYTPTEVDYFVGDAEPALMVVRPKSEAALGEIATAHKVGRLLTLDADGTGSLVDAAAGLEPDPDVVAREADDIAAILYTSGTTGRSKGAMLSHGNLSSNALTLHDYWGFVPGDVLLHILPIYHVHGLFVALHTAILNASAILFHDRFDPARVVADLPRATVMMGVPTHYVRLLDQPGFDKDACANMRLFVSGSAPLLPDTFAAFQARTGHTILERYGMTEAGMITSNPYDGDRIGGTVGYPLPGVSARVVGEDGREVPRGEAGVLEITGPNVFKGYWRMPEKTAAEFRSDGYFVTGDVATMTADGRVAIVGRAKDLIISGGLNVYPKEIEALIDELPGVKESAVIGVPHPDFGEGVTAVIVPDGTAQVAAEAVRAFLKDKLAAFKQPKQVLFVDELPRNTMGKVQKNQLRDRYQTLYSG
jgi:malonyl-CoA/methylmalonyl-CoA synthetase